MENPLISLVKLVDFDSSGYQCWLMHGLNVYLLTENRGTDILSKNKEGIFSILGKYFFYPILFPNVSFPQGPCDAV